MNNSNIVIGIEGLVGAGKTSICRELLKEIPKSILLNGSNLYRAIIYCVIKEKGSLLKAIVAMRNIEMKQLMKNQKIEISLKETETHFYQNGIKIEEKELQSKRNSFAVSLLVILAKQKEFYPFLRDLINGYKKEYNIIISGRDIVNIYPEIDYHFFITAEEKERIKRKCIQYESKSKAKIKRHIKIRDALQRWMGFYHLTPKTIEIDVTKCKNVEQSTKKVLGQIENQYNLR